MVRLMKVFSGLLAALVAQTGAALASDPPAEDGIYIRLAAGVSFVNDWEQSFTYNPQLVFGPPAPISQTLSNSEDLTAAFAVGFDYADGIRTELEYRYVSSDIESITQTNSVGGTTLLTPDSALEAHFVVPNVYFDLYNKSDFTPFIGAGVGGAFVRNESGQTDATLVFQGRAGVSLDLGDGYAMAMEYLYARTKDLDFGPNPLEFTADGPFEPAIRGARYESSSVLLTVRKLF